MIDTQTLGLTTAKAMDYLDNAEEMNGGRIVGCMLAVIVEGPDGSESFTRTFASDTLYYRQIGLAQAALECIKDGFRFFNPADRDEDDDDE